MGYLSAYTYKFIVADSELLYYHLKVKNERPSITVGNCRVILKEIHLKDSKTKNYKQLPLAVPPNLRWAPAETSPLAIDFTTEQILDFGFISKDSMIFCPSITPIYNSFQGYLKANEIKKYTIEIQANNTKPKIFEFEVSWDGKWNDDLSKMKLIIEKK